MGVIGIIYEARPNVTVDAAVLCFKAGSACIPRRRQGRFQSSMCLTRLMREALAAEGLPENAINLVEDTSRDTATQMDEAERLSRCADRAAAQTGSAWLSRTRPYCDRDRHGQLPAAYIDATADLEMAKNIPVNAKCQRPSVCNAAESPPSTRR